tara:strand:+ start:826 stop:1677 length:852 start_codon:yes stop_codon:yes gene_type:complete
MIKIGLTGYDGWLGSQVKLGFENRHSIISLDFLTRDYQNNIMIEEIPDIDWVFHFGAKTSIVDSFNDPIQINKQNVISTLSALEIAHKKNAKFLYLSSYIYGEPKYSPLDEDHPIAPNNPYMISKWIGEEACNRISKYMNIPCTIFRPFNIYGPVIKKGRLISDLLENALSQKDLILNDKNPIRDYIYIDDFIEILRKMVCKNNFMTGVYNIGSGFSYSNFEVAKLVQNLSKKKLEIIKLDNPRKNDISVCTVNNDKIKNELDWEPSFDLKKGLSKIFKSLKL